MGGIMTVLANFKYDVKPGRLGDFMAKLGSAADPRFNSPPSCRSPSGCSAALCPARHWPCVLPAQSASQGATA